MGNPKPGTDAYQTKLENNYAYKVKQAKLKLASRPEVKELIAEATQAKDREIADLRRRARAAVRAASVKSQKDVDEMRRRCTSYMHKLSFAQKKEATYSSRHQDAERRIAALKQRLAEAGEAQKKLQAHNKILLAVNTKHAKQLCSLRPKSRDRTQPQ